MRISDWSSDVCSSDLIIRVVAVDIGERIVTGAAAFAVCRIEQIDGLPVMGAEARARIVILAFPIEDDDRASPGQQEIGRASCRERVWQYVSISVVAVSLEKKTSRWKSERRE